MFRHLSISGGSCQLSRVYWDKEERDKDAAAELVKIRRDGLFDGAVILLDNASDDLTADYCPEPVKQSRPRTYEDSKGNEYCCECDAPFCTAEDKRIMTQ